MVQEMFAFEARLYDALEVPSSTSVRCGWSQQARGGGGVSGEDLTGLAAAVNGGDHQAAEIYLGQNDGVLCVWVTVLITEQAN